MELVKITKVKSNPNNPRIIRDDKFNKLVQSLKDFPEMSKVRPIVANKDMVVLGGNMRLKAMKEAGWKEVPDQWKFGNLFTSSISNYNISAAFHRDAGNIKNTVNVIITKRRNSKGGNLHVPDYGATIDQCDNSILVYPAWRNVHGVTPIEPIYEGGYRNSLVFYPLKAFINKQQNATA